MASASPASRRSQPVVSLNAQVRIPEGVLFKDLSGETVLLNLNTGVYFGLDPIGTRIWQFLESGRPAGAVARTLLEEYDVDEQTLMRDLARLLRALQDDGLIEPA